MNGWRKLIRITDSLINLTVVLFFMPILLYGIYAFWDSQQVYKQADSTALQTYKPTSSANTSFEQLRQINPEVFGWLVVEGTPIDYPLVQAQDNTKYVNTDVKGNFSLAGSIFLDCRNHPSFTDVNHILYGHHMQKEAMFGSLQDFADPSYFEEHPYGKLFYDNAWHEIAFFAFVQADAYDPVLFNTALSGTEGRKEYIDYVKKEAAQFRELPFTADARYVVLSTCTSTSTNGRHLLIGRITDTQTGNTQ